MVKFSDLMVDKSLHGLTGCHSVACLIFMMSFTTNSLVMLAIDTVRSFLQLMDSQNECKNTRFSQNKSYGKGVVALRHESSLKVTCEKVKFSNYDFAIIFMTLKNIHLLKVFVNVFYDVHKHIL